MTWQHVYTILLLVVGLSGCMVGPNYRTPQAPVPAAWSEAPPAEAQAGAAAIAQWWTTFKDPVLESLIARAVQSNWDLRTATGRVREARPAGRRRGRPLAHDQLVGILHSAAGQ
jgi:outer membrane protein, multidrug efflux system